MNEVYALLEAHLIQNGVSGFLSLLYQPSELSSWSGFGRFFSAKSIGLWNFGLRIGPAVCYHYL
jgi:hypothetical protein